MHNENKLKCVCVCMCPAQCGFSKVKVIFVHQAARHQLIHTYIHIHTYLRRYEIAHNGSGRTIRHAQCENCRVWIRRFINLRTIYLRIFYCMYMCMHVCMCIIICHVCMYVRLLSPVYFTYMHTCEQI